MARKILFNIFAWMVVLMVAFPLFWMLVTSVKPSLNCFAGRLPCCLKR